jgi:hypothetical protein
MIIEITERRITHKNPDDQEKNAKDKDMTKDKTDNEKDLQDLIQRAADLGVEFIKGPATYETMTNPSVFHVVDGMSDDTFREALERKIEAINSTSHKRILDRLGLLKSPPTGMATLPDTPSGA